MIYCYHRRHLFKLFAAIRAWRRPLFPTAKWAFLDEARTKQVYCHEISRRRKSNPKIIVRRIYGAPEEELPCEVFVVAREALPFGAGRPLEERRRTCPLPWRGRARSRHRWPSSGAVWGFFTPKPKATWSTDGDSKCGWKRAQKKEAAIITRAIMRLESQYKEQPFHN